MRKLSDLLGLLGTLFSIVATHAAVIPGGPPDAHWSDVFTLVPEFAENAKVYCALRAGPGFYIGGSFNAVGGVAATNVAFWNGTQWQSVGHLGTNTVRSLALFEGSLYAGLELGEAKVESDLNMVAKWNGQQWSFLPNPLVSDINITRRIHGVGTLAVRDGELYAGVLRQYYGGSIIFHTPGYWDLEFYKWNGTAWSGTDYEPNVSSEEGSGHRLSVALDGTRVVHVENGLESFCIPEVRYATEWIESLTKNTYTAEDFFTIDAFVAVAGSMYIGAEFKKTGTLHYVGNLLRVDANGDYQLELYDGLRTEESPVVALAEGNGTIWALTKLGNGVAVHWKRNGVWSSDYRELRTDGDLSLVATADTLVLVSLRPFGGLIRDQIARFAITGTWSRWKPDSLLLDGKIRALTVDNASSVSYLKAAGDFTRNSDRFLNRIALLDAAVPNWHSLGSGITEGPVTAMVRDGFTDYAAVTNIYQVSGTTVTTIPVQPNLARWVPPYVQGFSLRPGHWVNDRFFRIEALAKTPDKLFAGGKFVMLLDQADSGATNLAQWDGAKWAPVGAGSPDACVWALLWDPPNLYVGGRFSSIGSIECSGIAKWDGQQWQPLGEGLNGPVFCMARSEGYLVVGGDFNQAGGAPARGIARWNGTSWEALGAGIEGQVRKVVMNGTDVFAAGWFSSAGGISANNIAWWHENEWRALGSGLTGGDRDVTYGWGLGSWGEQGDGETDYMVPADEPYITGLALTGEDGLFVAGSFTSSGGKPSPGISLWTGARRNRRPTVSILPLAGTVFQEPANILIEAQATDPDPDGRVVAVEFQADGQRLQVLTSAPYRFEWRNAPAGQHVITAIATDDHGSTAFAQRPVSIQSPALPSSITVTPAVLSVFAGERAAFTVIPPEAGVAYRYQWQLDGQPLQDSTRMVGTASPILTISSAVPSHAGHYTVLISVGSSSVLSEPATLEVKPKPVARIRLIKPEADLTFTGNKPIALEATVENFKASEVWYYASGPRGLRRVAISKTGPKYTATWSGLSNGPHQVWAIALDEAGYSVVSEQNGVSIEGIAEAPYFQSVAPNRNPIVARPDMPIRFSAQVLGSLPMKLHWEANGNPMAESERVHGTESSLALTIDRVKSEDGGRYRLVAENSVGLVRSAEFVLQVNLAPALRFLPEFYTPGAPLEVRLSVLPRTATQIYALEEVLPAGWTLTGGDGTFDPATGKAKFGPFFDDKPRTLLYTVQPALSAEGLARFSGTVSADATAEGVQGDTAMNPSRTFVYHPADTSQDNRISISELTKFALSWRKKTFSPVDWMRQLAVSVPGVFIGNPNPALQSAPAVSVAAFVTRAAMIWKRGEAYYFMPDLLPPICWTNDTTVVSASGNSGVVAAASPWRKLSVASAGLPAVREFSAQDYAPGLPVTVRIRITPAADVIAYAIEERHPSGWTVLGADGDPEIDASQGTLAWGPFFDNEARILTYQIAPAAAATGLAEFSGLLSIDGREIPIGGAQVLAPGGSSGPVPWRFESIVVQAGEVRMLLKGPVGSTNALQISSDLGQWRAISNLINQSGEVNVTLPLEPEAPYRFFRTVSP